MTMYTQILIHGVYMYSRSGRTNARLATSGDQKPIEKPPIYRHKAINFNINTLHITLHRRCFIKQDTCIVSSKKELFEFTTLQVIKPKYVHLSNIFYIDLRNIYDTFSL